MMRYLSLVLQASQFAMWASNLFTLPSNLLLGYVTALLSPSNSIVSCRRSWRLLHDGQDYVGQMVKPMLGLAGSVLFKANYQEGPINPHRVRDAKSRYITPVWRKLGWQEWNKTPGIGPSLPPFTKYICALIKKDILWYPCPNMEQPATAPATSSAIRGAEQSGNIAK